MAQTIKLKRSSTGGAVPSTSSLSLGEVAINTYDGKMYIKKNDGTDSIVQIGAGSGSAVWNSYDYTATSSQTSFSGNDNNSESLSYVPGFLQVFLNGILLDPAVDYAATTGSSIVLTVGASTSDLLQIETFTQIIGTGDILVDTFPVSSTQTAFTLSQDPINKSNISVYVEGVYQESSTYSLSTTTLTLSESPANGTTVEVVIGTRNVTLDNIADLTISGTLHAGALDLGDANIINVNEISLDTIKGDADANTNITFAGSDVTTFTQGGQERLRLNTTGAQVTGNIVVSGTVDGRDVAADGVTADAALSRAGGAMGGAITTNSTFDGRDVSVDGTKLDGIESGATADQTDVEIRAAVESASDSNVFTNADHSKLDAIEALADVTDATNVTAAGALMDSEVTNLAQVKAFDSSDYATAAQGTTANAALPKAGGTMSGALNMGSQNITNIANLTSPSGSPLVLTGDSGANIELYGSGGSNNIYMDAAQVNYRGTNGSGTGSIAIGTTVVIDGSRNLTNIGTISSGAITSTGDFSTTGSITSTDGSGSFGISGDSNSNTYLIATGEIRVRPSGTSVNKLVIGSNGNITTAGTISSGAITSSGKIQLNDGADIQWAGGYGSNKPLIAANANVLNFYTHGASGGVEFALTGSAVDFKNNPATNVGTISSGAITTSGNVSVGGSAYTTATDLNLLGDGISIKNDKAGSNNNWSLIQNTDTGSASNLSFTTGLGVALTLNHNKSATFGGPITGTTATASGGTNTTALASTAFVQQEITTLIGGAPANLDTLNELAAAINDEASYAAGITNLLTLKAPLASPTFTGDVGMVTGHSSGKFAVMASSVHGSYDFYNNGTSYFNGSVTVDDVLNVTGTNKAIQMNGVTRINGVGDIIGTSYYVGANAVIDTSRNITAGTIGASGLLSLGGTGSLGSITTNQKILANFDGGYSTANSAQNKVVGFIGTTVSSLDIFNSTYGSSGELSKNFYLGLSTGNSYFNNAKFVIVQGGVERFNMAQGGNSTFSGTLTVGGKVSGEYYQVAGTTVIDASRNLTGTSFTDGYISWSLAQLNRYGSNIELQYTPTNAATTVKIGANGSNPTIFNAYTGVATFSGNVGIGTD